MKLAVVTALYTDDPNKLYGDIIHYEHDKDNVDYICYTNSDHISNDFWDVRKTDVWRDGRWSARKIKTAPHRVLPEYDAWLWMDAQIYFTYDPVSLVEKHLGQYDVAVHSHSDRTCIYQETQAALQRPGTKRDIAEKVIHQAEQYKNDGYPEGNGLYENGILFRKNNDNVVKFNEMWFEETAKWNTEDQISFCYSLWKMPEIKVNRINKTFIAHQPQNNLEKTDEFYTLPRAMRHVG
tara:strand:+ start:427 stop:1137 length:711 start_codon:yes stop_codon:yes gene_type:complete